MYRNIDIEVLKADRCTENEAKKLLDLGTVVYEKLEDYIEELEANGLEYDPEDTEDVEQVEYNGHTYTVVYAH